MRKAVILFFVLGFVFLSSFAFAEEKKNTQPQVIQPESSFFDTSGTIFTQSVSKEDKCFFLDMQIWPAYDVYYLISITNVTNASPPLGTQGSAIGISYRTNQGLNTSIVNQSR